MDSFFLEYVDYPAKLEGEGRIRNIAINIR